MEIKTFEEIYRLNEIQIDHSGTDHYLKYLKNLCMTRKLGGQRLYYKLREIVDDDEAFKLYWEWTDELMEIERIEKNKKSREYYALRRARGLKR